MARNVGYSVENNFTGGLVTEATGLNFPENSVTATDNCVFHSRGMVSRRDGIDLEANYAFIPAANDPNYIFSEYLWEGAGGDGNTTLLVQQRGPNLLFFLSGNASLASLSSGYIGYISLDGLGLGGTALLAQAPCQFSTGLGRLIVTNPTMDPILITFNKATNVLTSTPIQVQTRDFKGVEPRPNGLRTIYTTPAQRYNLYNQGWQNKIDVYRSKAGFYPNDYEVWWLYKTPDAFGVESFLTDVSISAGILNNLDRGNSPAPNGSIILSEFYQDRSGITGIGGIPVVTSGIYRPSTTAFHAGRVFYAGVNALDYNSLVYFSQILESDAQLGRCYQENDPTSQYSPDLLPTDGGVISIPEAGTIYKLWPLDNSLLVFASTGVWQITGSQGIGFSAIDYTVKKVSSIQTNSAMSFVNVQGAAMWWGLDGIYLASTDEVGGVSITPVSDERIKTYYQDIPEQSKLYAKGAYNPKERIIQWVFRTTATTTIGDRCRYDSILNFDTTTKAFYPWSLPAAGGFIRGITCVKGLGYINQLENVTDNLGEVVLDGVGNAVQTNVIVSNIISSQFKYTTTFGSELIITYSNNQTHTLRDWSLIVPGGFLRKSYFTSGYRIRGEAIRKHQTNYLRIFSELSNTVVAFTVSNRWDYTTSGNMGRWTSKQVVLLDPTDRNHGTRRLKLRGSGITNQIHVESVNDYHFFIVGWSSFDSVNERP